MRPLLHQFFGDFINMLFNSFIVIYVFITKRYELHKITKSTGTDHWIWQLLSRKQVNIAPSYILMGCTSYLIHCSSPELCNMHLSDLEDCYSVFKMNVCLHLLTALYTTVIPRMFLHISIISTHYMPNFSRIKLRLFWYFITYIN